ncbi:MAG: tRNA (guanosine(37)-N1)-methyltransferase TrmD [Clostridiaceae bacterium]|nr:MAG: tRNA (guanosine(37)-N1)-methyltransferase TrmD [Clostridiaceae bacterium]
MKITILSLFPNMFDGFLTESIIKRAIQNEKVEVKIINFRDYSVYNNKQVDDTPYGGGAGMVLMCDPIFRCLDEIRTPKSHIIILSPEGSIYNEKKAKELSKYEDIILICGHYEGFDERIKTLADEIISVGDFVLTGGEIPAMLIADSIIRLLPGAITNESLESESFNENLLDYPVYTKPAVYRDMNVPDILLSGDHKKIDDYRESERIRLTKEKRPDLLK